ncbi:MAG: hypothetical protein NTW12_06750 [Deltaproteobacteria bacterium]|nr:hypothetical protein [Deltaproteobacteria bacterium]
MTKLRALLYHRNFIFVLAVMAGLFFDHGAQWTSPLVIPALSIVMTLSIIGISNNVLRSLRSHLIPILLGIFMNFIILGNFIIGMSAFLVHEETLWIGFILIASVPPAVSIIPFTDLFKGNETYAVAGTIGAYIGALIIIPVIAFGLLDIIAIDTTKLFAVAIELIIIPVVISRVLIWKQLNERIKPVRGIITDWSFFLIIYTLVGLNRETIIGQPFSLAPVAIIGFASTFLLGFLIELTGTLLHFNREKLTSLFLLGTLKNYGLAGGLALSLFSKEAALPATILTIVMFIYTTWLNFKMRWT